MNLPYILLITLAVSGVLFGLRKWRKLRITLIIAGCISIIAAFITMLAVRSSETSMATSADGYLYLLIGTGFILASLWVKRHKEVKI